MKKSKIKGFSIAGVALSAVVMMGMLAGCGGDATSGNNTDSGTGAMSGTINVVSREDGSGTRSAFVELFGIEEKQEDGTKVDRTRTDASITNSTAVMLTNISNDPNAIGYVSMGSINDSVKPLDIDGAAATTENVKNGSYAVSRPFNIVTGDNVSEVTQDFINFILSADGQKIVENEKYIASVSDAAAFEGTKPSGKIVIAGSSSVSPVMEALKEAYLVVNPNATIEIQTSDSTTGVNSTIDGICDIGMASRDLKETETASGVKSTVIAIDGVAVIVNNSNTVDEMTKEEVKSVYVGETTDWSQLN